MKKGEENVPHLYELEGTETLGSYLQIEPCSDNAPELSKCSIQWYRVSPDGAKKELISGTSSKRFALCKMFCSIQLTRDLHIFLLLVWHCWVLKIGHLP